MYSWQDVAVWLIVAGAVAYLWRKLGPERPPEQIVRLKDVRRRRDTGPSGDGDGGH